MKTRKGFYIRLDNEEVKMVAELKEAAVNVTRMLKNAIRSRHEALSEVKQ